MRLRSKPIQLLNILRRPIFVSVDVLELYGSVSIEQFSIHLYQNNRIVQVKALIFRALNIPTNTTSAYVWLHQNYTTEYREQYSELLVVDFTIIFTPINV